MGDTMERLGTDLNATGSVMSREQHEQLRKKRGECVTCGRKCFQKKLFKMIPITDHGRVLNGRCLNCKPLDATASDGGQVALPAASRPATREDLARFTRSQSNLALGAPGARSHSGGSLRRGTSTSLATIPAGRSLSEGNRVRRSASVAVVTSNQGHGRGGPISAQSSRDVYPSAPASPRSLPGNLHRQASVPVNAYRSSRPSSSFNNNTSIGEHSARSMDSFSNHGSSHRPGSLQGSGHDFRVSDEASARSNELHDEFHEEFHEDNSGEFHSGEFHEESYHGGRQNSGGFRQTSNRSLQSFDEEYELPKHGVLNRGGAIEFETNVANSGSQRQNRGSSRTMSSMSSMGEDDRRLSNGGFHRTNSGRKLSAQQQQGDSPFDGSDAGMDSSANRMGLDHSGRSAGSRSRQPVESVLPPELDPNDYGNLLLFMQDNATNAAVQREGMECLSKLHLGEEDYDALFEAGVCDIIVSAMDAFPEELELQLAGCRAIWNCSATGTMQEGFVESGAVDVMVAAMDAFIQEADVQETAMAAFSNLGAAEVNLIPMVEKGAVARIVEAMNKHTDNVHVQSKGCTAITNLGSHVSPFKKKIVEMGGGGAVVISMVMHPNDNELQEKALRALRNLCAHNDDNKVELANIGGIDAVISAMQVHRDQAGVQEAGAWTLSNLAGNDENKAVIGDCGGIDVIVRAMWVHSDNVGVEEWCCRALYTLTIDPQNSAVVMEVGGISAIVNAMQAHVDSVAVQEMGCAVLGNLADDDTSRIRIVDEEALDAIVLAMVLHGQNVKVQERACLVLLRLAIAENYQSMLAANVGSLVTAAAQQFPENCDEPARGLLNVLEGN